MNLRMIVRPSNQEARAAGTSQAFVIAVRMSLLTGTLSTFLTRLESEPEVLAQMDIFLSSTATTSVRRVSRSLRRDEIETIQWELEEICS